MPSLFLQIFFAPCIFPKQAVKKNDNLLILPPLSISLLKLYLASDAGGHCSNCGSEAAES